MFDVKMIVRIVPVLSVLMFVLSAPATAATAIDKESANAYFAKCVSTRDERMTEATQEELCACTSVQMMRALSVEDVQVMGENTPRGRMMLNKMLIEVYGPCMAGPVKDMVSGECDRDPRVALADQTVDRRKLCGCMADKTGAWFESEGRTIMKSVLDEQPYTADPISPVMESKIFKDASYEAMLACMGDLQGGTRR